MLGSARFAGIIEMAASNASPLLATIGTVYSIRKKITPAPRKFALAMRQNTNLLLVVISPLRGLSICIGLRHYSSCCAPLDLDRWRRTNLHLIMRSACCLLVIGEHPRHQPILHPCSWLLVSSPSCWMTRAVSVGRARQAPNYLPRSCGGATCACPEVNHFWRQ